MPNPAILTASSRASASPIASNTVSTAPSAMDLVSPSCPPLARRLSICSPPRPPKPPRGLPPPAQHSGYRSHKTHAAADLHPLRALRSDTALTLPSPPPRFPPTGGYGRLSAGEPREPGERSLRIAATEKAVMTSITEEHRRAFQALTSGTHENFALFSCAVDGAPAAAIVAVNECPLAHDGGPARVHIAPALRFRHAAVEHISYGSRPISHCNIEGNSASPWSSSSLPPDPSSNRMQAFSYNLTPFRSHSYRLAILDRAVSGQVV